MCKQKLLAIAWPTSFAERVRLAGLQSELDVKIAQTPREFMALYPSYEPDVVAFQVFMIDVDGIEMINWLGRQDRKAGVLLSAADGPEYAEAAKVFADQAAIDVRIVRDPADEIELRNRLTDLLGASSRNGQVGDMIHE